MKELMSNRVKSIGYSGLRMMMKLAKETKEPLIDFSIGDVVYNTSTNVCEACWKALQKGYTHYTPVLGLLELRKAIAEKLIRENNIKADPESEILISAGGSEGLMISFLASLNPGNEVLLGDPYYALFVPMIKISGGKAVSVPLKEEDDFVLDPESIKERINSKTKMIILCDPHNPTGRVRSKEELKAVADIAADYNLLILSDETYEKIIYDDHKHLSIASLPGMNERTITMISLSKYYAVTGLRLAYVVAEENLMNEIGKVHAYNVSAAQTPGQYGALEAIRGPQDEARKRVEEYELRRNLTVKRLNEIEGVSCHMPMGTFYAFPNVSSYGKTSFEVAKHLLMKGKILTVHGTAYGQYGEGYIRLNFAYCKNMREIEDGLNRMEEALKELRICP